MTAAMDQEIAALMRARGQEPRGLLCREILIDERSLGNSEGMPVGADLVQGVVEFVNRAMNEAMLWPGEFPAEAFCAYYADYYLAQVNNGGHGQWAGNSGFDPLVVKSAGLALEAMRADEYQTIYCEFLRLMQDKQFHASIMASGGAGKRLLQEEDLDSRFFALDRDYEYPLLGISASWLRNLPMLRPLPADLLATARAEIVAANPYRAQRIADAQRIQEQQVLYWVPLKLCNKARVKFQGLTAGQQILISGKPRFAWYMQTDRGLMLAAFFKTSVIGGAKARLYQTRDVMKVSRCLSEVSISHDDYAAAVPPRFDL